MSDETFSLNPEQGAAMLFIEQQCHQLAAAASMLKGPNVKQPDAAKVLDEAVRTITAAKLEWLRSTQKRVQTASVIPDKLRMVTP